MASNTKIQVKRSTTTGKPASLSIGELAYSYLSNTFFIGTSDETGTLNVGGYFYTSTLDSASSANGSATLVKRDATGNAAFHKVTAVIFDGNATTASQADKWTTARSLTTNGDITSNTATVDGTSDVNVSLTLTTTGVTAKTYGGSDQIPYFTVDTKGRLSAAGNIALPSSSWTVAGDTGSDSISTGGIQTFIGGDGIDTVVSDGANPSDSNVTIAVDGTVVRTSGDQTISGIKTFNGTKTIIQGDLQVTGTTIYANSTTLQIGDNLIVLNNDVTGSPSEDAGIEINRGNQQAVDLFWSESLDAWSFTGNTGLQVYKIASNTDVENVLLSANGYADIAAAGANGYARTVGAASNTYAETIGAASNTYADTAAAGANGYARTVGSASNTYAETVGAASNTYAQTTAAGANGYTQTVGAASNTYAQTVGSASNTYAETVGAAGNSYARTVGTAGNNYVNATFVKLIAAGQTITGNLAITGSLTVSGNAFTLDTETLKVSDPLIYLAGNNYTSDIVDIGFVGNYNNGSANLHTGIFRDATSKQYYIFDSYNQEPDPNHIDTTGNNFTIASLNAYLNASQIITGTLPLTQLPTVTVPYGGTGQTTFTTNGILLGNGTSPLANISSTTEGHVLKISNAGAPEFGMLDGGTF